MIIINDPKVVIRPLTAIPIAATAKPKAAIRDSANATSVPAINAASSPGISRTDSSAPRFTSSACKTSRRKF